MRGLWAGRAFTLIELLVVVGIICVLLGILLPAMSRAKQSAKDARCCNQIRQIYTALAVYLPDYNDKLFWRGYSPVFDGMDWYVYGGRTTGNKNLGQAGLFNRFNPRPLNPYVSNVIETFHCPEDMQELDWADDNTHFEWVGNSYNFNSNGTIEDPSLWNNGLAGRNFSVIEDPSRMVFFFDASFYKAPTSWHAGKHNVCLADGHLNSTEGSALNNPARYLWKLDY
jgi:prepilin-type N-terminal cleavage/methylation domain-containing protein